MSNKYCGNKNPPPAGKTYDTRLNCLKKGFGAGLKSAEEKTRKRMKTTGVQANREMTGERYKGLPKSELERIGKSLGIKDVRNTKKADLVKKIKERQ
jgi:hypothetical protein